MTVKALVNQVEPEEVKSNDLMAFTYWGIVDKAERDFQGSKLTLTDIDSGLHFVVDGDSLIEASKSAEQFAHTIKVNKTDMVDILSKANNVPFTVVFIKKDGSPRTLRGRLIGIDQKNLGYLDVEDLDKPEDNRFRLVDCRTIKSLIVNGVKYVV